MPSTTSSSVSSDFASSTVITPSLPTFFMASAIKWPISASPLAEIVPTWAISSFDHLFGVLLQILDHRLDGAIDAAFEVHRVHPCRDALGTFLDNCVSEDRRSGGAIAGLLGGL